MTSNGLALWDRICDELSCYFVNKSPKSANVEAVLSAIVSTQASNSSSFMPYSASADIIQ